MRTVFVELKVKLVIKADDDAVISDIINEMDYNFTDTTTTADIEDSEILEYDITDSK